MTHRSACRWIRIRQNRIRLDADILHPPLSAQLPNHPHHNTENPATSTYQSILIPSTLSRQVQQLSLAVVERAERRARVDDADGDRFPRVVVGHLVALPAGRFAACGRLPGFHFAAGGALVVEFVGLLAFFTRGVLVSPEGRKEVADIPQT